MNYKLPPSIRNLLKSIIPVIIIDRKFSVKKKIELTMSNIDRFFAGMSYFMRIPFILGLYLIEWSPILSLRALKPLSKCAPELKARVLRKWQHSKLWFRREIFKGIIALIMLNFYSKPEVYLKIKGYNPDKYLKELKMKREALLNGISV